MERSQFRLLDRLRVRWAEIDAQHIVFNAHYLMYIDTAIAAYWRAMAMPYAQTMAALGGDLFVRKASLEYLGSARYDDMLDIGVRCERIGNSSMTFAAAVFRSDKALVAAELVYVFADPQAQAARPVPPALREALQAFESGAAMVDVRLGAWAELGGAARAIRDEVFVQEQGIPAAMQVDSADADGLHGVAFNRFGAAVATARLLQQAPGVARLGRMAVRQPLRGSGVGRQLLDTLTQAARERGDSTLVAHAQVSAVPFYRAAGFAARGAEFSEAGIAHLEMFLPL
jgi:YbgC/YbaW family acyl-CoA thioester hydrolase